MASAIKGITIEIGGNTTGLDKALQNVNKQSRSLQSELNAVDKLLKFDPTNTELLAQKQELLAKQAALAADRVQTLRDAQEQVGQQLKDGTITDEAYRAFQREVAAAEQQLKKANAALDDFNDEASDAGAGAENLAENVKESGDAAKDAGGAWDAMGGILAGVAATAAAAAAAVAAAAGKMAAELIDATNQAATYADDMATLAVQTGVSTDSLQAYSYAAELVDVSLDTLTGSMAKQIKSMKSAADGSAAYVEAYDKLGVSIQNADGSMRDSEQVYWELVDALGKVENETERDALAMQLLGKSAQDLNPLISLGSEALGELMQEAEDAGAVLSEDTLDGLLAVSDGLERMKSSATAATNNVGTIAAGALSEYYNGAALILQDFTKLVQSAVNGEDITDDFINGFVDSVTGMVQGVADQIPEIVDTVSIIFVAIIEVAEQALPQIVQTIAAYLPELLATVGDMLPSIVGTVAQILGAVINSIFEALPTLVDTVIEIIVLLVETIIDALPDILECGVEIIISLVDGITKALPKLIPAAVKAIVTVVKGIVDSLPRILDAALQIILALVDGILAALPQLIAALPAIIISIVDFILGAIPQIIQAGITLLVSLVGALPEIIAAIVAAIPLIIDGIISAVLAALPLIIQAGIDLLIALVQALPTIIVTICNAIPEIIDGIITALLDNLPALIQAGVTLFIAIVQNLPTIIVEIVKAIPQIITGIVNAITGSVGKIASAGGELIKGLWNGIQDAGAWLWDKISGFFDGVVDKIKDFFGIHSPSKLFEEEIGKYLAEGVGVGFEDEMESVADDMQNAIPTNFDTEVNAAYHSAVGATAGAHVFDVTIPLALDGKILTRVVSRIQYSTQTNRAVVLGAVTE